MQHHSHNANSSEEARGMVGVPNKRYRAINQRRYSKYPVAQIRFRRSCTHACQSCLSRCAAMRSDPLPVYNIFTHTREYSPIDPSNSYFTRNAFTKASNARNSSNEHMKLSKKIMSPCLKCRPRVVSTKSV